ncbi:hypothetical protein FIBSPDRAFT_1036468 [Athelia psychrophila]|uniref:ABC transmembrane type-1 domain-containing protein n=1 Tax=Athelia psychrophila TaxID=1759441 RepID=A0A166VKK8_9AGAM|nr:hypothetical protein FIBSPDRAFT_1036468 [Fibularhizoctonia sp. CBS 109695]
MASKIYDNTATEDDDAYWREGRGVMMDIGPPTRCTKGVGFDFARATATAIAREDEPVGSTHHVKHTTSRTLSSQWILHFSNTPGAPSLTIAPTSVWFVLDGAAPAVYVVTEGAALAWVTRVLAQGSTWFDAPAHALIAPVQTLIKDSDDARSLIAMVLAQFVVVVSMVGVLFDATIVENIVCGTSGLAQRYMRHSDRRSSTFAARSAPKSAIPCLAHLKPTCPCASSLRRAALSRNVCSVYLQRPDLPVVKNTTVEIADGECVAIIGASGSGNALIYLAEALLLYVGALLIACGTYTYLQMVQVLDLVVFTATIGSQPMASTHLQGRPAARDFHTPINLSTDTDEPRGVARPHSVS